ncbi:MULTISPECIES: CopG family ribbon-helix-helix protein [Pseudomonas]|uniref:Predicted transcriptional regulator n=1 Tax=Pseudomonas lutea TaxID=243924 RepID=A0A9X8MHQ2_9PSED|nr:MULTISPECIES: CopG family ribbon-helix-helix protein [Pseudomonas]SER46757.1 Predicted transcriptional regulator [Pseudomonas lutea]
MSVPVTARVEKDLAEKLQKLADATDRDRSFHIERALRLYVEQELWHVEAIQEGIADADAGNLVDLTDIQSGWIGRAKAKNNSESNSGS